MAAGAVAVLPDSWAASSARAARANALAGHGQAEAARATGLLTGKRQGGRHGLVASAPLALATAFFQAAPLATYAADCTTPQDSFSLGDDICVKVSGAPISARRLRVVLSNTAGFNVDSLDVTAASETFTFTLPSAASTGGIDNRGNWTVGLVDTSDATLTLAVIVTVHDPDQQVADLTISKIELDADGPVAGTNTSYQIYVWNRGPDSAANVRFSDNTLPNTTFVSLTQNSGPTFNCTSPSVGSSGATVCTAAAPFARGDSAVFTAVYHVSNAVGNGTELDDTATVTSDTYDPGPASDNYGVNTTASNPTPPACTISCPANITVTADLGQTGAVVTFGTPAATGSCGTAPVAVSPASGSFFAIGTSVVTATTQTGQSCSFTVTVNPAADNEAPSISCPGDISVPESSSSSNSANVTYTVTATDNSGTANVTCNPPSGSAFAVGTHEVVCTATDPSGNSATCQFNVTVTESNCNLDANSAPPTPNAASLPTLTGACSVTLIAADDPTATDACGRTIHGLPRDTQGDPIADRTFDVPGDYTVVWTYTDSAGHTTTQNQLIHILPDNTPPVPDKSSLPDVTGECSAAIAGDPPTATDNCAGSIEGVPLDPLSYNTPGTHTVRWKFTDAAGNSTIQNQNVVVTDSAPPVPNVASLPTLTGECSVTVTPPTAHDNCAGTLTGTTPDPLTYTAEGTYTVHWTYTDQAGNSATQNQTVIVDDTTAPVPNVASLPTVTGECSATVTPPTATDNCAGTITATTTDPTTYTAQGTYTVHWTYNDGRGNSSSQNQTVIVHDTTPPVISCPANITVFLPLHTTDTSMAVGYPAAAATDNCGTPTITYSKASGSVFNVGTTPVTATADDGHGNTASCTFYVTVLYDFTGFFSPVANPTTVNSVNAGRAIPVKFSLSGNKGLAIFADGSPSSTPYTCGNTSTVDVSQTVDATANSINYDASSDQYNFIWKTDSSWAGQCRTLSVTLNDGSVHTALFKFR